MQSTAAHLSQRLAENAEAVCRAYLSNGKRSGRYWVVGDAQNAPGASLYVRLFGPARGPGAAGKWTDAAEGTHGDLLDIIRIACGHTQLFDAMTEASRFLSDPLPAPARDPSPSELADRSHAARRLFHMARPVPGTIAETYLRSRGIAGPLDYKSLRFHPSCYHRAYDHAPLASWPALLASVTDLSGNISALQRTWLATDGLTLAPLEDPRRAMGNLLGHAVRFGEATDVLIAGEGIETILSLRCVLPWIPAAAALTANHLALMRLPLSLQRLYIARDNDPAGAGACDALSRTALELGIHPYPLIPAFDDWNSDLQRCGPVLTLKSLLPQLQAIDRHRRDPDKPTREEI
jgi:hypothetical protein